MVIKDLFESKRNKKNKMSIEVNDGGALTPTKESMELSYEEASRKKEEIIVKEMGD